MRKVVSDELETQGFQKGVEVALDLSRALTQAKQHGISASRSLLESNPAVKLEYFEGVNEMSFECGCSRKLYSHSRSSRS